MTFFSKKQPQPNIELSKRQNDPQEAQIKAVLHAKWKEVLGSALGSYGTGNMFAAGEMMYDALFAGTSTNTAHGYVTPLDERILQPNRQMPDKEEFVEWFRQAMVHDYEFQKECAFPGAIDAVDAMMSAGPLVLWTEGDTLMTIDGALGSGEQLEKIRGIGAYDKGLERALSTIALSHGITHGDDPGQQLVESTIEKIVRTEASERKFSHEVIDRIVDHFRKLGIHKVVVLEDRMANAARMQQILERNGFDATGIWVQQGRHGRKNTTHDETVQDATTIADAGNIITALREQSDQPIGTVCDVDGVLADQEKREKMQIDALYNQCRARNWIL
ncbi:hypothetical protein EOL96_03445 [Candidatus Saccharibacteria bacterium]|nr:hypothetical protein [Candidatus Saccharibacteria bacterium]